MPGGAESKKYLIFIVKLLLKSVKAFLKEKHEKNLQTGIKNKKPPGYHSGGFSAIVKLL
jgi:hypothetical protein